jgi:hypothetical protein
MLPHTISLFLILLAALIRVKIISTDTRNMKVEFFMLLFLFTLMKSILQESRVSFVMIETGDDKKT